jgi:hypothetical protein
MKKFTEIQYQRPNLEDFANLLKTNIEAFKNAKTAEERSEEHTSELQSR